MNPYRIAAKVNREELPFEEAPKTKIPIMNLNPPCIECFLNRNKYIHLSEDFVRMEYYCKGCYWIISFKEWNRIYYRIKI